MNAQSASLDPSPPRTVPIEAVEACDLCGGSDFELRREWKDGLLFGPEIWRLVACKRCSLHFIDPRPTREVIGSFYPQDYGAHTAKPTQPSPWHRLVSPKDAAPLSLLQRVYVHLRQDLSWYRFPEWQGQGRVLDVGCGSGGRYLDVLKGLGWTTYGVEPSAHAVASAVANGHQAVVGNAEDPHFPEQSMDVVTMWHVLEHTHSPARALETCFQTLRPGGELSLCIPNWASLQAKLYGRYWWSCDAPRHLYQFTKSTIRRYLEQAGFENVRIKTRTGATSWQRAARHFLNAVFRKRWAHDSQLAVTLSEPLVMFGSMVRFFGMGAELRVIARRPE